MKNLGRVVGINIFFTEIEKVTGEPKLFEYTYGSGLDIPNEQLFYIDGVFVFVWNVTNSAYDIYPEHRIHSVGVVYENDNQPKPGRQIVSFGVPPEAQQQIHGDEDNGPDDFDIENELIEAEIDNDEPVQ